MTSAADIKRRQRIADLLMEQFTDAAKSGIDLDAECEDCMGPMLIPTTQLIEALQPSVDRIAEAILAEIDAGRLARVP